MALEAVLVLVFLLLPGVVADGVYRFLTWRPDPTDQGLLVRATAISFGSLFALLLLQRAFPTLFVVPPYLEPAWWRNDTFATGSVWGEALRGWLQHATVAFVGSVLAGFSIRSAKLTSIIQRFLGRSLYSSAWDEFAVASIGRWVLVTLSGGRVFYGVLGIASGDRSKDVVLHRPMPFDRRTGAYEFSGNKTIFIREDQVESVLVPLEERDLRLVRDRLGRYRLSTGERIDDQEGKGAEAATPQHE